MLWGEKDIDFSIKSFKGKVCASCSNPIILYNLHGDQSRSHLLFSNALITSIGLILNIGS